MEDISAYFELEKDETYKGEIRLYGFKILYALEPVFDNESSSVRLAVNFSQNPLFEKLGKKFQNELKISLTAGIYHCYNKYNQEKTNQKNIERAMEELKLKPSKNQEDWDYITSDMILQVPPKVKDAIERIAAEGEER